jgi:streptomycin 6-kinase
MLGQVRFRSALLDRFGTARCRASFSGMFTTYLDRWELTPDGEPIVTHSSRLLPVKQGGSPAILKIALSDEERDGAALMSWWSGEGAARVLAKDDNAILLERAEGETSLVKMAQNEQDDEASRIICNVVAKLHGVVRAEPPTNLVPLSAWFRDLEPAAGRFGGVLLKSAEAADHLLATPQDVVVLHGDIHHDNILDFGARGWLAIDPKGLIGERGFDYANIFCNPDQATATAHGRLRRQATVVAEASGLEQTRLLRWILAYAGLSAAWGMIDGEDGGLALSVAEIAATELANCQP